jgi:hypothetical protein
MERPRSGTFSKWVAGVLAALARLDYALGRHQGACLGKTADSREGRRQRPRKRRHPASSPSYNSSRDLWPDTPIDFER